MRERGREGGRERDREREGGREGEKGKEGGRERENIRGYVSSTKKEINNSRNQIIAPLKLNNHNLDEKHTS